MKHFLLFSFLTLSLSMSSQAVIQSVNSGSVIAANSSVSVGENVQLQIKVEGLTNLTELRFPTLECQPGFSGFFQTSDLPPLAESQGNFESLIAFFKLGRPKLNS